MREKRGSLTYYQFHLPLESKPQTDKRKGSSETKPGRCHSRNTVHSSNSPRPCSQQSQHSCISIDQDTEHNQISQHILVGSTLRRPHATEYSPLDYQCMPDVGKAPRQPFRPKSSCTVYTYADRPVSAREQPTHLGRHTKSSLLRCKSASSASLSSVSSTSTTKSSSSHSSSSSHKRLCEIRDDYRFFKGGSIPKQIAPHGETMHGFLTGARYNRARFLDSRALSKLGVYISKEELNSFFVKDEYENLVSGDHSVYTDSSSEDLEAEEAEKDDRSFTTSATNTDPHYLSIDHWHSAEWRTDRKPCRAEPRAQSAPLRIKAIKAYYYDYGTK